MRGSRCLRLEADVDTRVALLLEEYAHFVAEPAALSAKLELLRTLHGAERIAQWQEHLARGRWQPLVRDLLENHYDPAYNRSLMRNYRDAQSGTAVPIRDISPDGFLEVARALTREHG
jgi:tRNA 2-selenouridine synthase